MHFKANFPGLDIIRGCSAIAVLLFHSSLLLNAPWLMQSGYLAVDLFFLLSGFVVSHSYDERIREEGFLSFMRIRVVRFYPLYLLGTTLGLAVQLLLIVKGSQTLPGSQIAGAFLTAILFLPAVTTPFLAASIAPLNGPAWSLILEFWGNAAYALLVRFGNSVGLIASMAFSGAYLVTSGKLGGPHWGDLLNGIARFGFSFPAGVLIHRFRARLPAIGLNEFALTGLLIATFMVPPSPSFEIAFVFALSPIFLCLGIRTQAPSGYSHYLASGPTLTFESQRGFP